MFFNKDYDNVRKGTSEHVRQRRFRSDCTFVRPAKIQIRLRECAVWSESSSGAFRIAKSANFFIHVDNENSDQTARMYRLFESSLGAHVRRYVFCRSGSYNNSCHCFGKSDMVFVYFKLVSVGHYLPISTHHIIILSADVVGLVKYRISINRIFSKYSVSRSVCSLMAQSTLLGSCQAGQFT